MNANLKLIWGMSAKIQRGYPMKKSISIITIVLLITGFALGKSPNMSLKVGGPMSTAQVLFRGHTLLGRTVLPTVGLDYFSLSTKSKDEDESQFVARLFIPRVGGRITNPRADKLRSYLLVEAFTVIPLVSSTELTKEQEGDVKDVLDLLGLTVGWGAEYFFSPQFSVGGEASLNWNLHDTEFDSFETTSTLAASVTRLTFNFYFR